MEGAADLKAHAAVRRHARHMPRLTLRRIRDLGPPVYAHLEDYSVLEDGEVIGRIYESREKRPGAGMVLVDPQHALSGCTELRHDACICDVTGRSEDGIPGELGAAAGMAAAPESAAVSCLPSACRGKFLVPSVILLTLGRDHIMESAV